MGTWNLGPIPGIAKWLDMLELLFTGEAVHSRGRYVDC